DQYDLNVQVFGSVAGDKDVVRGDIDAKSFSVFHLLNETGIGVTAVNAPRELRAGKQLVRSKGQLSN
uniref:oxidoreductase C-terminal domain-containing protein n=1 Tax=Borreliella garinii TaxID=29519 RepID=UPI001AEF749B